jgi:hypothetical protein
MLGLLMALNGNDFEEKPPEEWRIRDPPWVNYVFTKLQHEAQDEGKTLSLEREPEKLPAVHREFLAMPDYEHTKFEMDVL